VRIGSWYRHFEIDVPGFKKRVERLPTDSALIQRASRCDKKRLKRQLENKIRVDVYGNRARKEFLGGLGLRDARGEKSFLKRA